MVDTLVTLFTARTQATILAGMYADAQSYNVDVIGVQAERLFRALFEIEAQAKSNEDYLRVQVAQAGFLQTVAMANYSQDGTYIAPPNWTDLIAVGWFNLPRFSAVATVGAASLTCSSLATPGTVPALQAQFSGAGQFYTNQEAFTVTPSTVVPITLVAATAGAAGNIPVNSGWTNITTLAGCAVTNPGTSGSWVITAGVDAETDQALVARCMSAWAASSYGGARSAYGNWVTAAFTSAGLTPTIPAYRIGVDDTNPNGPGSTDIYLADIAGPASTAEVALVNAYLQPLRGLGTGPLRVFAAPAVTIPITAAIFGNANGVALGTTALSILQSLYGLGGTVFLSNVYAALSAPSIPGVVQPSGHVDIALPAADVALVGFQVPVFAPTLTASA